MPAVFKESQSVVWWSREDKRGATGDVFREIMKG